MVDERRYTVKEIVKALAALDSSDDKIYTMQEAAVELQLNPSTVRLWCREGKIPCTKYGRSYRVTGATLSNMKEYGLPRVTDESYIWEE